MHSVATVKERHGRKASRPTAALISLDRSRHFRPRTEL